MHKPKGPSSPYLWFWVPNKALKSCNREYLDPLGKQPRFCKEPVKPHSPPIQSSHRSDAIKPYLNPEEPTFLGFLIMISLYKSLKR